MEGDGRQGETNRDALYKVAYEEAVRALSLQQEVIESIRGRAGLLLSAASITTSFLGAQALDGGDSGPASWLALSIFVAVAVVALAILWPRDWELSANPSELIRSYIETDESTAIEALHRDLSLFMHNSYVENRRGLGSLATRLQVASALLTIDVILWIIAIATAG